MRGTFLAILLCSSFLFHAAGELFQPNIADRYSDLYPFLQKWAAYSRTRMLTVVFDDYAQPNTFDIPRSIVESLNVSIKLMSLRHLIYLKNENMDRDYQTIESGSCVLLLFLHLNNLRDILSSPHLTSFWQPENWYILQEQGRQSELFDYQRFCKWAFERLWRFRRIYKLLLFTDDKVIRYDPFDYAGRHTRYYVNGSCDWYCVKSNEDSFLMIGEPSATDVSDFFDEERKHFKQCPLKISIFPTTTMPFANGNFSGLDFKYLEEMCARLNVTPVLVKSKDRFGWEEKGVFFGTVGHLVYEFADVSFNQFFIKDYQTRQVEFSTSVSSDKLCVIVPRSSTIPEYLVIFKIFSAEVWLLIFVGYFVISVIYTIMRKTKGSRQMLEEMGKEREVVTIQASAGSFVLEDQNGTTFKIVPKTMQEEQYETAVGNNAHPSEPSKAPRSMTETEGKQRKRLKQIFLSYLVSFGKFLTKVILQIMQPYESSHAWFPERLFLMCSLLLSLILNGVFSSQLASDFSKRMYYKDIDTLEELEESGLTILTNSKDVLDDALSDSTSPVIQRLHLRLQYANELEIHRRLFETKDAGYLHRLSPVTLKYNKYEREKLHIVQECPKDYILAFVMTKGSPFRERINTILGRLNNGGFYWKWYERLFQSKKRADREVHSSTTHRKVSIRHLFIPFMMLYFGLGTSVIIFILEYRRNHVRSSAHFSGLKR